jgi:predicted RNA-binding Zn ribbon-like protein
MALTELVPGSGLGLAVGLINSWDEFDDPHEHLRDEDVIRRWLHRHGFELAAAAVVEGDVERARTLRTRLTAAFDAAGEAEAVELLNALLAEHGLPPRLEPAPAGWRFRSWPEEDDWLSFVAARAALGLLDAIADGGWERFGRCAGSPCRCVFVDRSRNRTRRYCSQLCADRVSQANHRRRAAR